MVKRSKRADDLDQNGVLSPYSYVLSIAQYYFQKLFLLKAQEPDPNLSDYHFDQGL